MDTLTPIECSERTSRVQWKNTSPEMTVRRLVHGQSLASSRGFVLQARPSSEVADRILAPKA